MAARELRAVDRPGLRPHSTTMNWSPPCSAGSRATATGDTRWKVPGVLDWSTGIYNPCVDVTPEKKRDDDALRL